MQYILGMYLAPVRASMMARILQVVVMCNCECTIWLIVGLKVVCKGKLRLC